MDHGWVPPEAPSVAPVLGDADAPAPEAPATVPPLPVPLRPMTLVDILDGALNVIRRMPRTVFLVSAVFVIPVQVLQAWANRNDVDDVVETFSNSLDSNTTPSFGAGVAAIVATVLMSLALVFVAGALARVIAAWYTGRVVGPGDAVRSAVSRSGALLGSWLLVHLAEIAAGVLLIVPGVLVMTLFLVTAPALVVERIGGTAAMSRSRELTRRRFGAVLGAALVIALVDNLLSMALGGLSFLVGGLPLGWVLAGAIQGAVALVTVPFVAAATVLLYLDLRIRTEGLDLELQVPRVFAGA